MISNTPTPINIKTLQIWMADLPHSPGSHVQSGKRPVLIVSNNAGNTYAPIVSVVPLTSQLRKHRLPTHVRIKEAGLLRESLALCEQILTLDKSSLIRPIGMITNDDTRAALHRAMAIQLGMVS